MDFVYGFLFGAALWASGCYFGYSLRESIRRREARESAKQASEKAKRIELLIGQTPEPDHLTLVVSMIRDDGSVRNFHANMSVADWRRYTVFDLTVRYLHPGLIALKQKE